MQVQDVLLGPGPLRRHRDKERRFFRRVVRSIWPEMFGNGSRTTIPKRPIRTVHPAVPIRLDQSPASPGFAEAVVSKVARPKSWRLGGETFILPRRPAVTAKGPAACFLVSVTGREKTLRWLSSGYGSAVPT